MELSGIGDKKILDKIGIPVQIDLPGVGSNVQEHGISRLCAGKLSNRSFILNVLTVFIELKDNVEAMTFDALLDPVEAAKHLEM